MGGTQLPLLSFTQDLATPTAGQAYTLNFAARALTGGAQYFPSVLGMALIIAMHWVFSNIARRWPWFSGLIKGHSTILIRAGRIDHAASVLGPSTDRIDPRHAQIYALADQGHGPRDIARELGRPTGEIELILALRPQQPAR